MEQWLLAVHRYVLRMYTLPSVQISSYVSCQLSYRRVPQIQIEHADGWSMNCRRSMPQYHHVYSKADATKLSSQPSPVLAKRKSNPMVHRKHYMRIQRSKDGNRCPLKSWHDPLHKILSLTPKLAKPDHCCKRHECLPLLKPNVKSVEQYCIWYVLVATALRPETWSLFCIDECGQTQGHTRGDSGRRTGQIIGYGTIDSGWRLSAMPALLASEERRILETQWRFVENIKQVARNNVSHLGSHFLEGDMILRRLKEAALDARALQAQCYGTRLVLSSKLKNRKGKTND